MEVNCLSNMTFRQVQDLKKRTDIALFPIGTTEAHGPQ